LLSLIRRITTGCLSYALKGKLPAGLCLIFLGTEGIGPKDMVTPHLKPATPGCWPDSGAIRMLENPHCGPAF
jgi:hypothetical protein